MIQGGTEGDTQQGGPTAPDHPVWTGPASFEAGTLPYGLTGGSALQKKNQGFILKEPSSPGLVVENSPEQGRGTGEHTAWNALAGGSDHRPGLPTIC